MDGALAGQRWRGSVHAPAHPPPLIVGSEAGAHKTAKLLCLLAYCRPSPEDGIMNVLKVVARSVARPFFMGQ